MNCYINYLSVNYQIIELFMMSPEYKNANIVNFVLDVPFKIKKTKSAKSKGNFLYQLTYLISHFLTP